MKPIIAYTNSNGKVEMTREEFEEIVNQVYRSGLEDGKKESMFVAYPNTEKDYTPLYPTVTYCTTDKFVK